MAHNIPLTDALAYNDTLSALEITPSNWHAYMLKREGFLGRGATTPFPPASA